jgi:hypothetical protein
VEQEGGASSVRLGGVRLGGGVRYNIAKFIVYNFCSPNRTTMHLDIDVLFHPCTSLTIHILCAFSQFSAIKFLSSAILYIKGVDYRRSMSPHYVYLVICSSMMCIFAVPFRQLEFLTLPEVGSRGIPLFLR